MLAAHGSVPTAKGMDKKECEEGRTMNAGVSTQQSDPRASVCLFARRRESNRGKVMFVVPTDVCGILPGPTSKQNSPDSRARDPGGKIFPCHQR